MIRVFIVRRSMTSLKRFFDDQDESSLAGHVGERAVRGLDAESSAVAESQAVPADVSREDTVSDDSSQTEHHLAEDTNGSKQLEGNKNFTHPKSFHLSNELCESHFEQSVKNKQRDFESQAFICCQLPDPQCALADPSRLIPSDVSLQARMQLQLLRKTRLWTLSWRARQTCLR